MPPRKTLDIMQPEAYSWIVEDGPSLPESRIESYGGSHRK